MPRRRLDRRRIPGLALFGALFLALGEQALGLGLCSHHAVPAGHGETAAPGEIAAPEHAHHVGHEGRPDEESGAPAPHGPHGRCTCLGSCHAATSSSLPPARGEVSRLVETSSPSRAPAPADAAGRAPTPFRLPYANAPPAAR